MDDRLTRRAVERSAGGAGDALLLVAADGTIEGLSEAARRVLGEELVGRPLSDILNAQDAAGWQLAADALAGAAETSFVGRVAGVASEPLVVGLATVRLADGARRLVASVEHEPRSALGARVLDVLDPVLDALGDVCYIDEILPDGRHHNLYASPGFESFLGRRIPSGTDAVAIWRAAVHVDDRMVESAFMAAVARGERAESEYRLVSSDGATRRVLNRAWPRREEGRLVVLGIVSEVGDDRQAEAEVREHQRRLADVATAIDDVFLQVELPDDGEPVVGYANPSPAPLLEDAGIDAASLFDASGAVMHEEDRERHADDHAALLRGEPVDTRYRVVSGPGEPRHLWVRARGRRVENRVVIDAVISDVTHHARPRPAPGVSGPSLTPRQREILGLLADGVSTKAIASRLGLSLRTVQNHVAAVLRELESHSRLEAVAKARRAGLL